MNTRTVFCPSCRRSVDVVDTDRPLHGESQATLADVETVCLQAGGECVDASCPVTGLSAVVMRVRLTHGREQGWVEPVHPVHSDFLNDESHHTT